MVRSRKPNSVRAELGKNDPAVVDLRLVDGDAIDPGEPDAAWLPETVAWWSDFWDQRELLLGLGSIDVHLVRRLASLKDLRHRALEMVRARPVVEGSMKQPVANPMAKEMRAYDAEIRQLEDRLGLSPKARLNMGLTFGQAHRSMEDALYGRPAPLPPD